MNEPTVINPLIIYFKSGSSQLSPSDEERLGRFLEEAKKTGNSSITIDGHTDSTGPERENKSLSISRSNSVKRYTQLKGFDFKSIIINGWGETRPIASNDDEKEGRELNRRVVVRVISN
ncbi:MAG: OmpA family protein [Bacteroidota bacterium]